MCINKPIDKVREWFRDICRNKIKEVDSVDIGMIKPLGKSIWLYGIWENEEDKHEHTVEDYIKHIEDGTWKNVDEHIKAYLYAWYDYGFKVDMSDKFCIVLVKNIKKLGRSEYIAYDMYEGLPEEYEVDYMNHLIRKFFNTVDFLLGYEEVDELIDYVYPEYKQQMIKKKRGAEKVVDITSYS